MRDGGRVRGGCAVTTAVCRLWQLLRFSFGGATGRSSRTIATTAPYPWIVHISLISACHSLAGGSAVDVETAVDVTVCVSVWV